MANIFKTDYLNTVLTEKGFNVDRTIGDVLQLPYDWYNIKIKPNDIVTARVINTSLAHLNDNFLYLIAKSRIPSNKIPDRSGYTRYIATTGTSAAASWYDNALLPGMNSATQTGAFSGITDGEIIHGKNSAIGGVCGVLIDNYTNVMVLTSLSLTGVNIVSSSNLVDNYTDRTFNNITDINITDNSILYILDGGDSIIYRYDFTGSTLLDPAYFTPSNNIGGRLLTNVLGGSGTNNATFSDPIAIATDTANDLYVVDGSNIKQYDNNTNWKKTYSISEELGSDRVVDLKYSNSTSTFYLLLTSGTLVEYDNSFSVKSTTVLKETKSAEFIGPSVPHLYKKIIFSYDNDNIFYVLTNKTVYKRFKTNPEVYIGKFTFSDRSMYLEDSNNLSFMSILSANGTDIIYLGDNDAGAVYNFNETAKYESAIYNSYEDQIVPLSGILINSDEYVNSITYNKSIGKILFNHKHLVNSIKSTFTSSYDVYGNKEYNGVRILLPEEISSWFVVNHPYFPDLNNYIGINELVLAATVNRTLKLMYDMQLSIIDTYRVEMLNVKPAEVLTNDCPPSPTPTSYTTPTPTPSVTPTLTPTIPPTPTPSITPTPTLPAWPYAQSYVFIEDAYVTYGTGVSAQQTYTHLNGTYTTTATGWGSYRYNSAPLYYFDEVVLYYNGTQWTFDDGEQADGGNRDDSTYQTSLLQRLSAEDIPAIVPLGEYYRTNISEEVIGTVT